MLAGGVGRRRSVSLTNSRFPNPQIVPLHYTLVQPRLGVSDTIVVISKIIPWEQCKDTVLCTSHDKADANRRTYCGGLFAMSLQRSPYRQQAEIGNREENASCILSFETTTTKTY